MLWLHAGSHAEGNDSDFGGHIDWQVHQGGHSAGCNNEGVQLHTRLLHLGQSRSYSNANGMATAAHVTKLLPLLDACSLRM